MAQEIETESFYKPEAKSDKIMPTPNLETPASAQKRMDPFELSNWSPGSPANTTKP